MDHPVEHRTAAVSGIRLHWVGAGAGPIRPPTPVLWATKGRLAKTGGVLDIWRGLAHDVRGEGMRDCGQFLPEEQPEAVAQRLLDFLA